MLTSIIGGYNISADDKVLINTQRAITATINRQFIQVGAVFLKQVGKMPNDENWAQRKYLDTNLQDWIDNPEHEQTNTGFNLMFGWLDIDMDSADPDYKRCILAALEHLKIDTRFRFGRASVGTASHVMVQLGEEEARNFEELTKFQPRAFTLKGERFHTELRSYAMGLDAKSTDKSAKQTVMPGSIYSHKTKPSDYDISVWFRKDDGVASNIKHVAETTPRKVNYTELVRAICFGTALYIFQNEWVSGQRQMIAAKVTGWLARIVADSAALNNNEKTAADVYCPVDCDDIAEGLIRFICSQLQDDEPHMRVRAFRDATEKLKRNPDAKVPGWPAMQQLFGAEAVNALRTVFMPGSDVSLLTAMAERYIYDETDNKYIDRKRHIDHPTYAHDGAELERRHRGDTVRVGGKPKEAFRIFETSELRKRIDIRDMFPDLAPGGIFRVGNMGELVADDDEETRAQVAFNTWRGWPIDPIDDAHYNKELMDKCISMLTRCLMYLTRDNMNQVDWILNWMAWTFQNPAKKQQIAWVVVGGQGVGKSFIGNRFMSSMMGTLWGSASPSIIEGAFNIEPFKDKMFVFIDEAKFHSEAGTDEIKKLIRSVDVPGQEKYGSARNYHIYARCMFASNKFDMNIGQANTRDRALFYTRAYDKDFLNLSQDGFVQWAEGLKTYFDEFDAMLNRRDVLRHFIRFFMDRKCDRHTIESLKFSSGSDPEIVSSNMAWSRRVAKHIIEDCRLHEDIDITHPFTMVEFARRTQEICKDLGFKNVSAQRIFSEFQDAALVGQVTVDRQIKWRFKYKAGELLDRYSKAIGVPLERRFEFTDDDFGENTNDGTGPILGWRGAKKTRY